MQVTGTVTELVPFNDPQAPPVTQLTTPATTVLIPSGQPLPAAIPLTSAFPSPSGPHDQLERVEHMRVSVASLAVTAPVGGTVDEVNAAGTNDGRFHAVVTGVARPFREPGIQAPDMPPSGSIPPIPRFDSNPERIAVDSDGLAGQAPILVKSGDTVAGPIVGPLTYAARAYTLLPEDSASLDITSPPLATTLSAPTGAELTVASLNLNRLFDTVNDPAVGDTVVTLAALNRRLAKISIAIRSHLHSPDIIGIQQVEKLATLQSLAARILSDGGPEYHAYLVPGNDAITGLNVGFLVKAAEVAPGLPRVSVNAVTQLGASTTWIDPASNNSVLLHPQPPLILDAIVNRGVSASFPLTVIVTDFRDMSAIDNESPDGLSTVGTRVRTWRLAQATFLADYLQFRQANSPTERLVVIGGFNALNANDGYVDIVNTVAGTPTPDNETVVPGDGVDFVNPNLVPLIDTLPANRYSQILNGHPAATDHVLVNAMLVGATTARRIERARLAADYAETSRNDDSDALRFSDRDPVVAYFESDAFGLTDLSITNTAAATVIAGETLAYEITVSNNGPDPAASASWSDTLPAGTVFASLTPQAGWSCTTPAVGAGGAISCTAATFGTGSTAFMLTVRVAASVASGTVLSNAATVSTTTTESDGTNNSETATTTVDTSANLSVTALAAPAPTVVAGQNVTYTVTVANNGPSDAASASIITPISSRTAFVSATAITGSGWSFSAPPVGGIGPLIISKAVMAKDETASFQVVVTVNSTTPSGALSQTFGIGTSTPDPIASDNLSAPSVTVDGAPTITAVGDVTIDEDSSTAALPFAVADLGTPAASLTVTATSSDQALIPDTGLLVGGSDATRSVTVTPVANGHGGPVTITLTVSDGTLSASETFTVTVTPVNDAPTIDPVADQTTTMNVAAGPVAIAIGDIDNDAADLVLSADSSNPALLQPSDILFAGSGPTRTVTLTPRPDQIGETTVTLTVSDGDRTASTAFRLTVDPAPRRTYYLAEGATGAFFDEDLVIANPNGTDAPVTMTFFREGAPAITEMRTVPARSGLTLRVDTLPGLEETAASVLVSSPGDLPLAVERTQFWGDGAYGGHTESAVAGASTHWYFAEGAQGYFDTFMLVTNPQAAPVDVTLTFLREDESAVTAHLQVPAFSRKTLPAASLSELAGRTFAVRVDAPQPVVAERAMYFGTTATHAWSGGSAAAGVTTPASTWFFAEGATGEFFDTFILLMNPEADDAQVTMRYLLDGESIDVPKVVPGHGRLTVSIDGEADARLRSAALATLVLSDRPIVAERSVFWPTAEGAQPWGESHTSAGVPAAAPRWVLAEGRTGGALQFHTYILLANPGTQPVEVDVQFLPDSGEPVVKRYTVPALSRFTIDATTEAPALRDRSFITLIETNGGSPIVAERSMYWDGASMFWSGGSNAFATRLP